MRNITLLILALNLRLLAYGDEMSRAKMTFENWCLETAVDRPWNNLNKTPIYLKRERGALAYVYRKIKSGEVPVEVQDSLYADLGILLTQYNQGDPLKTDLKFRDYQNHFEIDVFALWVRLITRKTTLRWNTKFKAAYYSTADATGVLFEVTLPPTVDDTSTFPMLVMLKHGPQVEPSPDLPFIKIKPTGRNIWGYRSMSRYDVMQSIEFMKTYYPIDTNRIYLTGFSAGASGAMHLATSYPDEFAAVVPMVAFGTDLPLMNLFNLPVAIHHGTHDWTSSICNVRVQYEKLKAYGCPVLLAEYPDAGHSVPKPHEPLLEWMLDQTRKPSPISIKYQSQNPDISGSYWFQILEFIDPHQRASVNAWIESLATTTTIHIQSENIEMFSINLDLVPGDRKHMQVLEIDDQKLSIKGKPSNITTRHHSNTWQLFDRNSITKSSKRPYRAGAAANLYQGEPLMVVYGTDGKPSERSSLLCQAAQKLATYGGPIFTSMNGSFPVVSDDELSSLQEANCNLILVGTPGDNCITRGLLQGLPISINDDMLELPGRPDLLLKNQVLSLLHPHPTYPDRLIYIVAPFTDTESMATFSKKPQDFLIGSDGFDRISQADLSVENLDDQIGRQMQFDPGWEWIIFPGAQTKIPARYRDRSNLARSYLKIMCQKSAADFAFWWGPSDKGAFGTDFNYLKQYNPDTYTLADYRSQHHIAETMTGGISGAELKEIWSLWVNTAEILSYPEMKTNELEDQKMYWINIPIDLYIKLGQRKKTLISPKPGPDIQSEKLLTEIFN